MDKIIDYYNRIATTYQYHRFNNTYGYFIDFQERKILNKLLKNREGKIVDLACGTGRLLNYSNYGVDASDKMIEISKQKFPEKTIYLSDASSTPFDNNSIDTIICFHFFMHLNDNKLNEILIECNRILKNNGRLIFDIPSKKRRILFNYFPNEWHGAYSLSINDINNFQKFKINKIFGILFLPIHRFPRFIRKYLINIDLFIANSSIKEYSSYLVVELIKK